MRNLNVIDRKKSCCSFLKTCQSAAIERSLLFFANETELCKLDLDKANPEEEVEILAPLDLGAILDVKYLPEEDVLAIVSRSGSVAVFSLGLSELEIVGDVSGGISACAWSPDMETLVIVSEAGNVLMMTRTWDVLSETPLFQEDFGEAKFVSVGWGSKETQFHGSEGKHARGKKEIVQSLADWDDSRARIVWRADGLFFAVNAVEPLSGYRAIRVFNREGSLQSTSEPVSQLEQSLSWKSSGASGLITSTVTIKEQGKKQVAFFEKNGLRHGEFDIDLNHQVLQSHWNGDSTVIALVIRLAAEEYCLQLWTMGNYHWYRKQSVVFGKGVLPLWVSWDPVENLRLHVISSDGFYQSIDYKMNVNSSKGLSCDDSTCVAVIDNRTLKLTFLRETVIPPPMCGWEIEFTHEIAAVDLSARNYQQLSVATHNGYVYFFNFGREQNEEKANDPSVNIVKREGRLLRPVWQSTASVKSTNFAELHHWRHVNHSTMVASSGDTLLVFQLEDGILQVRESVKMEARVAEVLSIRDKDSVVLVHLINRKTFELDTQDLKLKESFLFPEFCSHLDCVNGHVIGLASSGRLYVDGQEVMSSISSFALHSDFLLATSLQKHCLLCLSLDRLSAPGETITERAIERGAKLVHSVAQSTGVILQMPRGNLEVIHPRALSLNIVKSLIERKCYAEAFVMMKKQRINLNLIYDHLPLAFIENAALFVQQVGDTDLANLNLFISELQNEDYTTTMYQSHYHDRTIGKTTNKVDSVCNKLRQVMEETDKEKYILPIVTSLIKQNMLDAALKRVQTLSNEKLKDAALKYMAVLVDGDVLYKEALSTYDLQLTLMVAHRSQKDPKEYLAFLNELNAMADENERRFTIDNSLKKYDSALRNLCRCRPVRTEAIVSFMKLHRIYLPVVDELCTASPESEVKEALQEAAKLQAQTLAARDCHEEAGYLYQRVGLYEQALGSFQLSASWNNCLSLASLLNMSEEEVKQLATKLIVRLRGLKRHLDAAFLAEHYVKDYELAGQCLIDGLFYSEAWSLSCRRNMKEWAEGKLRKDLDDSFELMQTKLDQIESECCKHVARLAVVQQELLYKRDHPPAEMDHSDLFSETGSSIMSQSSHTTGKTFRSSKNRRKLERKKLRLKEGSPFEDMAIINELHLLYSSLNSILQDVGRLLRGECLMAKDWSRAKALQIKADALVKLMEEKKSEIWNFVTTNKEPETDKKFGPGATTEMIVSQFHKEHENFFSVRYLELEPKLRTPPESPNTSWKLDIFK